MYAIRDRVLRQTLRSPRAWNVVAKLTKVPRSTHGKAPPKPSPFASQLEVPKPDETARAADVCPSRPITRSRQEPAKSLIRAPRAPSQFWGQSD